MKEPRYTRPGKIEAYRTALAFAETLQDDELLEVGWKPYNKVKAHVAEIHPLLDKGDVECVSAKALRVERGKRRGQFDYKQENVRLNVRDRQMLDELVTELGISRSAAHRNAIRQYHRSVF